MLIEVCGLIDCKNIARVSQLDIDIMGFIFNSNSTRFADRIDPTTVVNIPQRVKKVGIFANAELEDILTNIYKYGLNAVQLHGANNEKLCKLLKKESKVEVIKALSIENKSNFWSVKNYEKFVDIFLFDIENKKDATPRNHWEAIEEYKGKKDFLISGNIGMEDIKSIKKIKNSRFLGVSINKNFETAVGIKDTALIEKFINEINIEEPDEDK